MRREKVKSLVCFLIGLPGGSDSQESTCNAGDPGLTPRSGGSPGEGNSYPLLYSCLKNSPGAWQVIVHGVVESQT